MDRDITPSSYALSVSNLTVAYRNKPVLFDVTTDIPQGVLLAIIGPNGAGKTTLIKSIINVIKPLAGTITIFDAPYKKQLHRIAYIPQQNAVDWNFPTYVLDVVLMGRYGHIGWFKRPSSYDKQRAYQALEAVDLTNLAFAPLSQLSGGQRQRVFLAQALAQDADIYLLDEPFVGVDAKTEIMTMNMLKSLRNKGKTILVVHHDLHTLGKYFDWALFLNIKQIACGPIENVFTKEFVCATYGTSTSFST
jgi:manganese/zinc/iron transport system ATP- binding protein